MGSTVTVVRILYEGVTCAEGVVLCGKADTRMVKTMADTLG